MNLRSLRPALTGLALLATASVVGCGSSDKVPVLPRLDVASVINGGSADSAASDDLAQEQLVNQQINVGHEVAVPAEPKKPVRPSLRDRLLPGRKTTETLADFSTDPFLDDLDKMLDSGTQDAAETAANGTFANAANDLERDAAAMFGPEPSSRRRPVDNTSSGRPSSIDPFGDIDLVASQATSKPAGNELEAAVFGDGRPVADSKFDQFLQQSAKPFNQTTPQAAAKPAATFDPLNTTDRVSLEPEPSEFEPFNEVPDTTPNEQTSGDNRTASDFEPQAATTDSQATATPPEVAAAAAVPGFSETTEPIDAPFTAAEPTAGLTVPEQDSATVIANAPASLPTSSQKDEVEMPSFTESELTSPEKRVEVDPSLYEPPPAIAVDPFEDGSEFAVDSAPQFRTANRQVTLDTVDHETGSPVTTVSETIAESITPSSAVQPTPTPARALIPPGEWTAWFLIAGAITVVLLLFAPGRGRS